MKNYILISLLLLFFISICSSQTPKIPLSSSLVEVCDGIGEDWIEDTQTKKSFYSAMVIHGVTQDTDTYCGVATSVMILNSLQLPAPTATDHSYPYFDQNNFFTTSIERVISSSSVLDHGFTLDQLAAALDSWKYGYYEGGKPPDKYFIIDSVVHASGVTVDDFRLTVATHMTSQTSRVIINFNRKKLEQSNSTTGHISPVIAYNEEQDSVLLFDVARYKFDCPTYWVPVPMLYDAMTGTDSTSNTSRGYIIITDPDGNVYGDTNTNNGDSGHKWYITTLIIIGGICYVSVTTVAIIIISAAIYTVFKNRKPRNLQVVSDI